ncbi:hypothetical protein, partial [uncultured Spirosoma sp.]|uniref:hypothetical protein n=1 Tax=uncultured Spirosoma sp. TaxID=278208 RepID=UPI0025861ED6
SSQGLRVQPIIFGMLDVSGQHSDYVAANTAFKPNLIPKHGLKSGQSCNPVHNFVNLWFETAVLYFIGA